MIHVARVLVAGLGLAVVAGCADTTADQEATPQAPTTTVDVRAAACAGAASQVVAAVERLVSSYGAAALTEGSPQPQSSVSSPTEPGESATEASAAEPTSTANDDGAGDAEAQDQDLATAVESAQRTVERLGCNPTRFTADVTAGLETIEPSGPVAAAVWRRVTASVLGEVEEDVAERSVTGQEELLDALAHVAPGSTVVLPSGTTELSDTVVLLDGVTLRGQGRDDTTVLSTAAEAAVIVATDGLVRLSDLTLSLAGTAAASGLVAGPSASVALDGVRVVGATRGEEDGGGGAGVYMSAVGDAGSGRGTTLEVTDSSFEDNDWAGIAVAGGHRVSIEMATVTGNGEVGILFMDSASGSVASSTLADNTIGLAATGSARPTWLDTTVTGGSIGAQVDATVQIAMQGMRVSGTSSAAVLVGGEVTGAINGLTCTDAPYGIVVGDGAAPTLADNDCPLARGG